MRNFTFIKEAEVYNSDSTDKICIETEYKTGKKFMSGLFSVIADTSKIVFKHNNLEAAKNVNLSIASDVVIKNNQYNNNTWQKPAVFSYNNSTIVFDDITKLNPTRTVKGLINSFINMPNVKIDGSNADDYIQFNVSSTEFKNYYKSQKLNQHDVNADLYLSPKFVNNGVSNFWTVDSANALYTNEELKLVSFSNWEEYCNLINKFPRNLNGNVLKINVYNTNSSYSISNNLVFNNFSGGLLQLVSNNGSTNEIITLTHSGDGFKEILFENCSNVDISFIKFENIRLKFINCYNINIHSCAFNILDNVGTDNNQNSVIICDNSKINIVNCTFTFGTDYLNDVYKIYATNAGKVFVNPNCTVTNDIKTFKKAYIDNNAQVTWFSGEDKKLELMENVSGEFFFAEFGNGLANHQHTAAPTQFGSEFIVEDMDKDSANDETTIDKLIDSITHTMPVGTTFYWPRAYLIKNISTTNLTSASYAEDVISSNFVSFNPHDTETYKMIYNEGVNTIISGEISDGISGTFTHEIPFLSGIIPFDRKVDINNNEIIGLDGKTWSARWKNEIDAITEKTGITSADLQLIPDTTTINSKIFKTDTSGLNFKFKDNFLRRTNDTLNNFDEVKYTVNVPNKFLNFTGINCNFTGPSVRQERADRFGYIQYFNNDFNGCGFVIKAGASHNWGGSQNTPFASQPQAAFTRNDVSPNSWPYYGSAYSEIAPPHDEFWYARQGLHVVYQVGGITDSNGTIKLPEYLEYGYLKFDVTFNKNLNGLGNWFGTLMICDNYSVIYQSVHTKEYSASGGRWPKEKFAPALSFIHGSLTKYNPNGKPVWYDPNDVPTYGNYFIEGNKTVYLPLNKIAGKFLVFGIRGTTSTNSRERDNGVYTGAFNAYNIENASENCSAITFKNFTIVPSIQPVADFNSNKWLLSNNSSIVLKSATKNKDLNNITPQIDLAAQGLRYYTDIKFYYPNNKVTHKKASNDDIGKSLSEICDFYIENSIISDTVLCMKANEIVGLSDVKDRHTWSTEDSQGVMWCFDSTKAVEFENTIGVINTFNGAGFKFTEDINNTNKKRFLERYFPELSGTTYDVLDLISGFNIKSSSNNNESTYPNGYSISGFPSINTTSVGAYVFNTSGYITDDKTNKNVINSMDSSIFSLYNGIKVIGTFDESKDEKTEFNLYNYSYVKNGVNETNNKLTYINNPNGNIWNFNAAYFQYKLAENMFNSIGQHLTTTNGMPYQYYAPFLPTSGDITREIPVQLVKYNMGMIENNNLISNNQTLDSDAYANPLFSSWIKDNLNNVNGKLGLYPEHLTLRRSIGSVNTLFGFTDWNPITATNNKQLELIESAGGIKDYAKIGLFAKKLNDIYDFNKCSATYIPVSETSKIATYIPDVYNIPYCKIDGVNDNTDIWFEVWSGQEQNEKFVFEGDDIWVSPTVDKNLKKYFEEDEDFSLLTKNFNIKFLNLQKVWKTLVEFSLANSLVHVNMCLKGEIPLNIEQCVGVITCTQPTSYLPGGFYTNKTSYNLNGDTVSACLDTYYKFVEKYPYIENSTDIEGDVLSKQYDVIVDTITSYVTYNNNNKSISTIKHPILLTQFTSLDTWIVSAEQNYKDSDDIRTSIINEANSYSKSPTVINPINDYYYNLNTNYGSVAYEHRIGCISDDRRIDKDAEGKYLITDKDTSITNRKIVYQNSISFGTDGSANTVIGFLTFCKHYSHVINHYMHKFREIYKGFSKLNNHITNNVENATADTVWKNIPNYCNGDNMAMFYSYANIINDPCIWKGYIWHNNETETEIGYNFNDVSSDGALPGYVCMPWGSTNWLTDNLGDTCLLGSSWFDKIMNSHFTDNEKFNLAKCFELHIDTNTYTEDAQEAAETYITNMKKAVSIYRPFYLEFDNCDKKVTETEALTLPDYSYGFIGKTLTGSDENGKEVSIEIVGWNPVMWNQDGGWYKNGFTFESIVNENN
jgi:hypothetical protein